MWSRDRTKRSGLKLLGAMLLAGCVSTAPTPQGQASARPTLSVPASLTAGSPAITPTPAPSEPVGWQLLSLSETDGAAFLMAVTTFRGSLVAIGTASSDTTPGVISCSADGRTWRSCAGSTSLDGLRLRGVGAGDPGLIIVGSSDAGAIALTSADGTTWSRSTFPGTKGLSAESVAWRNGTFAVVGVNYAAESAPAIIWVSLDGRAWSRAASVDGADQAMLTGVVAAPRGFVAGGSFRGRAAIWTSQDGGTWARSDLPGSPAGDPGRLRLIDGYFFLPLGQDLWSSNDGQHWLKTAIPGFGNGVFAVAAIPGGFVAVGRSSEGDQPGVVAIAGADLSHWTLQPADPAFDGALALDLVMSPDGRHLVGVGNSVAGPSVFLQSDPAGLAQP